MTSLAATPSTLGPALQAAILASPSYRELGDQERGALHDSLRTITAYLSPEGPAHGDVLRAGQLAPMLPRATVPNDSVSPAAPAEPSGPGSAPAAPLPTSPGAGAGAGGGTIGRVGEATRATLNAVDFPSFVASLIQGTFQAIVDASIQQMEAYAELLKNVAGTADQFMRDNIDDGTARDYLADRYGDVLERDSASGRPALRVRSGAEQNDLPTFFQGLGFETASDLDERSLEEVVLPATRQSMAEQRQQTLATMVMMGINRVVVNDGEIMARLQFHIDASESAELKFNQTKTTNGNMAGRAGRNTFSGNGILVNTTNVNAQSDINIRTDLTGQVTVRFRSESFPLERFADSAAIQLINSHAKVPPPQPPPPAGTAAPAQTGAAQPVAPAAGAPAPAAGAGAGAITSASGTRPGAAASPAATPNDPWAPRSA